MYTKPRSIGFMSKEMGYEISTCQMQYDAADKKTDQEDPCFICIRGNWPWHFECITYLGVTNISDLKWNTHVSNVCTKANRTLWFLRRNLYSCPQELKEAAYKGLVRLVLDYGSSDWDPSGVVLQEELDSVQKRAVRFVTSVLDHSGVVL